MTSKGPIKAITVRQPHATLLACGALRVHPLPWCHSYRGPIAIHAGTYRPRASAFDISVRKALMAAGLETDPETLTRGAIVGICHRAEFYGLANPVMLLSSDTPPIPTFAIGADDGLVLAVDALHHSLGDYGPGRFGLVTTRPRLLHTPIEAPSARGMWEWLPPGPLEKVR